MTGRLPTAGEGGASSATDNRCILLDVEQLHLEVQLGVRRETLRRDTRFVEDLGF